MLGISLPDDAFLDSFNVWDALLGKPGAKGREHLIQQDNGQTGNFGFRAGDWKLVRHDSKSARNLVVERKLANTPVPRFQLFDLAKDPGEETNLIGQHPERAATMKQRLADYIESGRSRPSGK
jgi:arylsulfatase A